MAQHNKLMSRLNTAANRQISVHRIPEPKKPKKGDFPEGRPTMYLSIDAAPFIEGVRAGDEVVIAICGKVTSVSKYEYEGERAGGSVHLEIREIAQI